MAGGNEPGQVTGPGDAADQHRRCAARSTTSQRGHAAPTTRRRTRTRRPLAELAAAAMLQGGHASRSAPPWLVASALAVAGCKIEKLPPAGPSSDDFERAAARRRLDRRPAATGASADGELVIDHAYNHPLWLKKPIPRRRRHRARLLVQRRRRRPQGRGLGRRPELRRDDVLHRHQLRLHLRRLAQPDLGDRAHERARQRSQDRAATCASSKGKKYHWRIARKGGHIDWQIDGKPFLTLRRSASARAAAEHSYLRLQRLGSRAALRQSEDHAAVAARDERLHLGRGAWCLWCRVAGVLLVLVAMALGVGAAVGDGCRCARLSPTSMPRTPSRLSGWRGGGRSWTCSCRIAAHAAASYAAFPPCSKPLGCPGSRRRG